ncbi:MAG: prolyl oligopeptidase family serine peptidase [Mycetocola sp.]
MRLNTLTVVLVGSLVVIHAAGGSSEPPAEPTVLNTEQMRRDQDRVPLAQSIVDAYPNWDGFFSTLVANWSPDGKQIVFGSLRDGLPEIYVGDVAKPADAPKRLTLGPERAIWARYSIDGKRIVFLRDNKGDENYHIWRINVDGTGLIDLTPGEPLNRDEPVLPRKRPMIMLYSAGRTTSPSRMLFIQSIESGSPKMIYTNPNPGGLADVTSDAARALFYEYHSPDDVVLLDVEVRTGESRRIYPPAGKKSGISSAAYSPDGRRIYIATDQGTESSVLLALDARTRREVGRYVNNSPATAPMTVLVSPIGDRVVVGVDAGSHGEVRILNAKTLALQHGVNVPLGDISVGSFRSDGKAFSLLISLPDHPADIYSVDAATGQLRPLREDKRPGLDTLPPIDASVENVKAFDGLTLPINVYLPKGRTGRLPTVVIFHGGPATSYAVRWSPYARFYLSLGYAVLEPNVRGSSGFGRAYEMADNREKRADWLKDLETVNAWTKSQPWCDPDRVVVWGQSYGGYTTLMALTRQPMLWRAGVDLYGIADLKQFLRTTDAAIRSAFVAEFGDLDKDGPLLEEYSPMRDRNKIVAPLFVYAGQNDPRVPRSESDTIVRALRERDVPVEYMVAANEGHTVDRRDTKIQLLTRTSRFLEDALSQPPSR